MKKIIIVQEENKPKTASAFSTLTELCRQYKEVNYQEVYLLKYPFNHNGYRFIKLGYNIKNR